MFLDYQRAILSLYKQKKAGNTLSQRLIYPTPANIRDECAEVIKTRFEKKDENTLNGFFGPGKDKVAYLKEIERYDIGKFKQLLKLLKGSDINTDERNIELLAWLINFEPRPFDEDGIYGGNKVGPTEIDKNEGGEAGRNNKAEPVIIEPGMTLKAPEEEKEGERRNFFIILFIAAICIWGYWVWNIKMRGQESCMYWNGDHYEPISCSKKMGTIPVIAFDAERAREFKKITRTDTITYNSLGKVWYTRSNNIYEYYTADGPHPLDPTIELKRITMHIIKTHLLKDSAAKK